jgi:hypothetical protein
MSLDLSKTLDLIKLGLTDPTAAWEKHFKEDTSWQETAQLLTGPIIAANAILIATFSSLFGGFGGLLYGAGFWGILFSSLIGAVLGVFVSAGVFSFLAGKFDGQGNFSRAFAAVSLAWVPAFLGSIVAAIVPIIGGLVALAGFVLSLVYLYRLMPLALAVPDARRVLHFILSLVAILIINLVISSVLGLGRMADQRTFSGGDPSIGSTDDGTTRGSGMIGAMQRQGELMEAAGKHQFEPPANGKVSREQIAAYVEVQRKANKVQLRFQEKLANMEDSMGADQKPSLASLSRLGTSLSGAVGAQNAEMELVITGGGNWAEHNWVKAQIQTAVLHGGEGNAAIVHNYKLFQPYMEELAP